VFRNQIILGHNQKSYRLIAEFPHFGTPTFNRVCPKLHSLNMAGNAVNMAMAA